MTGYPTISPILPLDVVELVAEILAAEEDIASLKSFSLVCYAFREICKKHIFSSLRLYHDPTRSSPPYQPPKYLLVQGSTPLANCVREIVYFTEMNAVSKRNGGPSILKYFSRVKSFEFVLGDYSDINEWKRMAPSLKSSLYSFIRANTISRLLLFRTENVPVSFFFQLPYLTDLELQYATIAASAPARKSVTPLRLTRFRSHESDSKPLLHARSVNGTPILDLTGLEYFKLGFGYSMEQGDDMDIVKGFLEPSTCLKTLILSGFYRKLDFRGKLKSILTPVNLGTLETLEVYPMLESGDMDPYLNLAHELEKIAGKNVLRTINLEVDVETHSKCTTDHQLWSQLDISLSRQGSFSSLRSVRILVTLSTLGYDYSDLVQKLEVVGRVCFPKLLAKKDMDFTFDVTINEIEL
ncbi:hypothetical protein D9613_011352 [Agrocybe pediades]|uniref:Uncharacterized protein n=1 Tax=Agrocybe pediades TaxID=84607 RepID=A0A8H4VPY2_9AGAR|nr:hypothetical protein D9613_011352 [Agrocybe pediades]